MQPLLNSWDVGRLLGINAETVKVYAREGRLTGIKIGNRWRFRRSAVERFIDESIPDHRPSEYDEEVVQFRLPRDRSKQ